MQFEGINHLYAAITTELGLSGFSPLTVWLIAAVALLVWSFLPCLVAAVARKVHPANLIPDCGWTFVVSLVPLFGWFVALSLHLRAMLRALGVRR